MDPYRNASGEGQGSNPTNDAHIHMESTFAQMANYFERHVHQTERIEWPNLEMADDVTLESFHKF